MEENHAMDLSALHTTSDLESLRSLALEMIEARDAEIRKRDLTLKERDREIHFKQTKIDALTAEIARLRRVQFAARSSMMSPEQPALFDEAIETDIAAVKDALLVQPVIHADETPIALLDPGIGKTQRASLFGYRPAALH